jgi:hypothetical protein
MMAEGDASTGAGTTAEAGKTFTQEQLDRIIQDRLAKERQKYEGVDLDDLKGKAQKLAELEASQQTAAEKLQGERDQAKQEAATAAAENLRFRVALEKKLPADLIDRLQGGTKEEMSADADKLLELVSPTPSLDGGVRQQAPTTDMDALIRRNAGVG